MQSMKLAALFAVSSWPGQAGLGDERFWDEAPTQIYRPLSILL